MNDASQGVADPQSNQVGKGGVSHYAKSVQRTLQKILTSLEAWNIVRPFRCKFSYINFLARSTLFYSALTLSALDLTGSLSIAIQLVIAVEINY